MTNGETFLMSTMPSHTNQIFHETPMYTHDDEATRNKGRLKDDGKEQNDPYRPVPEKTGQIPGAVVERATMHLATAYHLSPEKISFLLDSSRASLKENIRKAEAALDRGEFHVLAAKAHSLKGALLQLGLDDLAELAQSIETSHRQSAAEMACHELTFETLRRALAPFLA